VSAQDRLLGNVLGDHGLAETLGRGKYDVSGLVEEVQANDGLDERPVDFGRPVPVVVGHGFEALEAAAFESALKPALRAVLVLDDGYLLKELKGAPAFLGGERNEVIKAVGSGGQSESAQHRAKVPLGHGFTWFSAESASPSRS